MLLKNFKAKKLIKKIEKEMNLQNEKSLNIDKVAFVSNSALVCIATYLQNDKLIALSAISLLCIAYLSAKNNRVKNFDLIDTFTKVDIATKGKMNRMSFDDINFLTEIEKELKQNNLTLDDINNFASALKENNKNYINTTIHKRQYKMARKNAEKVLLEKMKSK
ncbi:MAG: hypothetical protein ACI4TX_04620 [Christensenellales bacterium]